MSRAFVRETDADSGALPARPISPEPNLVTPAGLSKIETRLHELERLRAEAADRVDDPTLAGIDRDLHYWKQRRASARVIAPSPQPEVARFGTTVVLEFANGETRRFQIVGEDEAEPAQGLVSWISPVGSRLIGRALGDTIEVFGRPATIVELH